MNLLRLLALTAFLFLPLLIFGQTNYWTDTPDYSNTRSINPSTFRTLHLEFESLKEQLMLAPSENQINVKNSPLIIDLPMPDGSFEPFRVVNYDIMEKGLSKKFPEIKAFIGQGLVSPMATARIDYTEKGFHAMIRNAGESIYIDPYNSGTINYYIAYTRDAFYSNSNKVFSCSVLNNGEVNSTEKGQKPTKNLPKDIILNAGQNKTSGSQLRTYRLAVSCTGEYASFHGGTVSGALSAITTSVNRVNGIYENEVAVRMVLVTNNNLLVYLNAGTDPFTNGNGGTMLGENITTCNSVIGSANYDIGHVFSTGGGGVAYLGVPCGSSKAGGVTGSSAPVGDPFDVDYVAHEMGHQFGANHTQNNSCNRASSAAYEPGSASTIMGYAGICSPNLQSNSDDHFHAHSHDEIVNYTTSGNGNSCPVIASTGNAVPVVDAGVGGFSIPVSTPFELTGNATDGDNDPLTYRWEQHDLGPATAGGDNNLTNPSGNAPIFRSFSAVSSPTRIFPKISDIVNNTHTIGEWLPTYARNLNFRFTVLDNQAGTGGVGTDFLTFSVDGNSGPFEVTLPNTFLSWGNNSSQTVGWDVANTDISPVNCSSVDIFLSTDGGYSYPYTLASNVPNTGSAVVAVPNILTSTARVKVKAANNVFFDISNSNFEIIQGGTLLDLDVGMTSVSILNNICGTSEIPSVTFTNLGTNSVSQVEFDYGVTGESMLTYDWTGSLSTGQSANVVLPLLNISGSGTLNLSATITEVNNVSGDENTLNDTANQSFYISGIATTITINLTTDCWGEEVSWSIEDNQGTTIASSSTTYGDQITVSEDICVGAGCYTFFINDSYGDGMAGTLYNTCGVDGDYEILDEQGNILVEMTAANYGSGTSHNFCITPIIPVITSFSANNTIICEGGTVQFTDQSTGSPDSWTWSFPGGTPVNSNTQNPLITYNIPGSFDVSLTTSNGTSTDDSTAIGLITVTANSTWYLDNDGDGFGTDLIQVVDCSLPFGYVSINGDCNDEDSNIYPGATEDCDGVDNNCNGQIDETLTFTTYYPDSDGDLYGDAGDAGIESCVPLLGMVANNLDCDDLNADINPEESEVCDGLDNNCNGGIDEGILTFTYYPDADDDGYGDINSNGIIACVPPPGNYVLNNSDCNDQDENINPTAVEICDGIDNNCDGQVDEGLTLTIYYADADNDGYGDINDPGIASCSPMTGTASNNADCDDGNVSINPGAGEVCDSIDNNCDGQIDEGLTFTVYYIDTDNDGYGDANDPGVESCSQIAGTATNNSDCDDQDGNINPGAEEICDGIDNNCNGQIDEGTAQATYYVDEDGDGYGASGTIGILSCNPVGGYVTNNLDCNDNDFNINPGAVELCNGIDDNCNGTISDEISNIFYLDQDNDGYGTSESGVLDCASTLPGYSLISGDCNDMDAAVYPNANELCDGIDNDCNGQIDEGLIFSTYFMDADNDGHGDVNDIGLTSCMQPVGYVITNDDCNDSDANINPGMSEQCDGLDNNCDGQIDEGLTFINYYADTDGDGYGDLNDPGISSCSPVGGTATNNSDCDDQDENINPIAVEICDGIDNNCDGQVDENLSFLLYYIDNDNDGFGDINDPGLGSCLAIGGAVTNNTDCDDLDENIHPGAVEICDDVDNNCDGFVDESCPQCVPGEVPIPMNLLSTQQPSGYLLTWSPVSLSIVCQVKGGLLGGADPASIIVWGTEPSQKFVPMSALQVGASYQWKVRCACSTNPIIAGPFSDYDFFTTVAGSIIVPMESKFDMLVYPNPASSQVYIESDQAELYYEIYNMLGYKIWESVSSENSMRIEVEDWPSGYYILRAVDLINGRTNQSGFVVE